MFLVSGKSSESTNLMSFSLFLYKITDLRHVSVGMVKIYQSCVKNLIVFFKGLGYSCRVCATDMMVLSFSVFKWSHVDTVVRREYVLRLSQKPWFV